MPLWLQSPIDLNQMSYDLTADEMQSLESLTRRLSIGQEVVPRPFGTGMRAIVSRPGSSCSISSTSSESTVVPPIHNKNYQESRYKTELCRHWEEKGTCPHGLQCLFAHGLAELKPFRGRHRKFKTQMCKAFHSTGFCSFGTRCSYIHEGRDVIPLLVQKYGYAILECLPSDNESLLRTIMANPQMLSFGDDKTTSKSQTVSRVQNIPRLQTSPRMQPTLSVSSQSLMSGQSPPRLSVFSKICSV